MALPKIISLQRPQFTVVLIGLFALAAVGCAELDLQPADTSVIQGVLQNVDSVSGEVTVELKDGSTTTFNLEDVDVAALQAIAGSPVLEIGEEVELTVGDDNLVRTVAPILAKAEGSVVSVDGELESVTIEAENGVQFTVDVIATTRIRATGHGPSDAKLSELVPGTEIKVIYEPESLVASRVQFRRSDSDQDEVYGSVSEVNITEQTIVVEDENGEKLSISVSPSTEYEVDAPGTLSELEIGTRVEVKYDPITMHASEIELDEIGADEPDFDD